MPDRQTSRLAAEVAEVNAKRERLAADLQREADALEREIRSLRDKDSQRKKALEHRREAVLGGFLIRHKAIREWLKNDGVQQQLRDYMQSQPDPHLLDDLLVPADKKGNP